MKNAPELDPELRGLLEEIAADPCSRMRLAPRRALRSWYLSGETVRPREIDATVAERHLVAAHREALAAWLLQAARVAYWRAPVLSIPLDSAGQVIDPRALESSLARVVDRDSLIAPRLASLNSLSEVRFEDGVQLARASLGLVPTDRARLALACIEKQEQPASSTRLLEAIAQPGHNPAVAGLAWLEAGSSHALRGDFKSSLACYQAAAKSQPWAHLSLFNLGVFMGKLSSARESLPHVEQLPRAELAKACRLLRGWIETRSLPERATARAGFRAIEGELKVVVKEMSEVHGQ